MNRILSIGIALAAVLLATQAPLAQGLASPPKNMARVQPYACTDGEVLAVTYYPAGDKPFVRVVTKDQVLSLPEVRTEPGKAWRHATEPYEWRSREGNATLTDTKAGKVLKTCRNATASRKP